MPELPEVQTTVQGLLERALGKKIDGVWTDYNSPFHRAKDNIKNPLFFARFERLCIGQKIVTVSRRAKNILIGLGNGHTILIHMKMTGHVLYGDYAYDKSKNAWNASTEGPLKDPYNRFIHFVLELSDGKKLALSDMRKFAKVTIFLTKDATSVDDLKHIGPEPLEKSFTSETLASQLGKRPGHKIKTALMNQELVAGIGNIYSDEILWQANIHPETKVSRLRAADFGRMHAAALEILRRSISLGGDSMSDYRNLDGEKGGFHPYHNAYRQHGKPCTKHGCKGVIRRKVVNGRSAHYCDVHQK